MLTLLMRSLLLLLLLLEEQLSGLNHSLTRGDRGKHGP